MLRRILLTLCFCLAMTGVAKADNAAQGAVAVQLQMVEVRKAISDHIGHNVVIHWANVSLAEAKVTEEALAESADIRGALQMLAGAGVRLTIFKHGGLSDEHVWIPAGLNRDQLETWLFSDHEAHRRSN